MRTLMIDGKIECTGRSLEAVKAYADARNSELTGRQSLSMTWQYEVYDCKFTAEGDTGISFIIE
jgi:hypothetical protein